MEEETRKDKGKTNVTHRGTLNLNGYKGIPGPGRPKMTPEEKFRKKIERDAYKDYLAKLEKLTPDLIKVFETAIKRLNTAHDLACALRAAERIEDRIFGKTTEKVQLQGDVVLEFHGISGGEQRGFEIEYEEDELNEKTD